MDVEYKMYFVNIGFYFVLLLIWICESSATCRLVFQSFIIIQPFQESNENCFAHFCPFVISMIIRRGKCVILEKLIYKNSKLEIVKRFKQCEYPDVDSIYGHHWEIYKCSQSSTLSPYKVDTLVWNVDNRYLQHFVTLCCTLNFGIHILISFGLDLYKKAPSGL